MNTRLKAAVGVLFAAISVTTRAVEGNPAASGQHDAHPPKVLNLEQITCEARNDFFLELRRESAAKGEKYDDKAPPWEIKPWLAPDWAPEHCPK